MAVHGQHEPQGLLDPASHLDLLDRFAGLGPEVAALSEPHRRLRELEASLVALRSGAREAERRKEMLEFQAGEIEKAGLAPGEEEALRQEKVVQANAGRLATLSDEAYGALHEDEAAVLSRLGIVYRRVEELAAIDSRFAPHVEAKGAILAQVADLALFLRDYRETLHVTPGRLDEIESRLATLERLKRKYGSTVEEVLAFGERCRRELGEGGSPEEREQALERERTAVAARYLESARAVSKKRRAAAPDLEKRAEAELALLAMERTRFRVRFDPAEPPPLSLDGSSSWSARGLEQGEFLLSPNPGEDLRPLARIASGGELSRILLALKSVVSLDAAGKTLVFDEVDAGIGGRVAEIVGRKLKAMASRHQVLCVTHLPQIASLAEAHYAVRKSVEGKRTVAVVEPLEPRAESRRSPVCWVASRSRRPRASTPGRWSSNLLENDAHHSMKKGLNRFHIETFGCQMNVNDSEKVAGLLAAEGMEAASRPEEADFVFINTCAVRERASEKLFHSLGRLRKLKRDRG